MDDLYFYKAQYAYLLGEIDRAVDQLIDKQFTKAQDTLVHAELTVEERWTVHASNARPTE